MSNSSENANVIPLHQSRKTTNENTMKQELSRLPEPVTRVRSLSEKYFKAAIQNMFDHVDDALFELADRTQSNLEQNVFFESMREIRIQRRTMEAVFMQGITQHFANLSNPSSVATQSIDDDESADDLSLVSKDELEELVAIDSLAMKASANNKNALLILCARLNSLVPAKVVEDSVPISPKVLADSFVEASKQISVDIKAKLVLFKLFERYVMSQLSSVLEQVNNELTELGIAIPKPTAPAQRPQTPVSNGQYVPGQNTSNNGGEQTGGLYDTLQSLLQSPAPVSPPASYGNHTAGDYGVEEAPFALMNVLSQLQQQISQVPVVTDRVEAPQLISTNKITEAINEANGNDDDIDARSNNVIKLVDMLFSFIMEDKNLPDPIKLLLSRLQIPFIKVALVDEDFFKKDGHAARRLLNEMATASIGWSGDPTSGRRDPLYDKINAVVEKVLNEFDNNFEIFSLLLADFVSFVEKERRRVMLFEKRAIDAEGGKAKAQVGRQYVEKQVASLLSGKAIPSIFSQFIRGPWSNILFLIYMRQGINSTQWADALSVAEELVWTALPIQNSVHKKKFLRTLPVVNQALHQGLRNISFNPAKQTKIFELLKNHHLALLQEFRDRTAVTPELPQQMAATQQVPEVSEDLPSADSGEHIESSQAPSEEKEGSGELVPSMVEPQIEEAEAQPAVEQVAMVDDAPEAINDDVQPSLDVPEQQADQITEDSVAEEASIEEGSIVEEDDSAVEEIEEILPSALDTQKVTPEITTPEIATPEITTPEITTPEIVAPEPQYINLVDNFVVGVWFERIEADSTFRCRLAAIIRGTGRYIFVNRSGVKVAEETRDSLALQLQQGQLRTLDDSMLFDRALESMITNLRKSS